MFLEMKLLYNPVCPSADWSVGASVGVSVIISSFTSFHALIGALVYFIACTNSFTLLLYTVSSGKYCGDL